MKPQTALLVLAVALSGCDTAYVAGSTGNAWGGAWYGAPAYGPPVYVPDRPVRPGPPRPGRPVAPPPQVGKPPPLRG